jgi:hypothetical protein
MTHDALQGSDPRLCRLLLIRMTIGNCCHRDPLFWLWVG